MPRRLSDERVERTVDGVLSEPPFTETGFDPEKLWQDLWDWYREQTALLGDLYIDRPVLFALVLTALLALLALLTWHIAVTLTGVLRALRQAPMEPTGGAARSTGPSLEPARRALSDGDPRRAVELAWTCVVESLAPQAGHEPGRPRTPRQQARAIASALPGEDVEGLEGLLRVHEDACYAGVQPGDTDARRALGQAERLLASGGAAS
jgi:hypothetical protein